MARDFTETLESGPVGIVDGPPPAGGLFLAGSSRSTIPVTSARHPKRDAVRVSAGVINDMKGTSSGV